MEGVVGDATKRETGETCGKGEGRRAEQGGKGKRVGSGVARHATKMGLCGPCGAKRATAFAWGAAVDAIGVRRRPVGPGTSAWGTGGAPSVASATSEMRGVDGDTACARARGATGPPRRGHTEGGLEIVPPKGRGEIRWAGDAGRVPVRRPWCGVVVAIVAVKMGICRWRFDARQPGRLPTARRH